MRRLFAIAVALVGIPTVAAAQTPRVDVDPRIEFMAIVFRLAGNPEYSGEGIPSYDADIRRQFGLFQNHPAITTARDLRERQGLSYSSVMYLAVNVSNPPLLLERLPFDAQPGQSHWRTAASSRFLLTLRRFAGDTRAAQFFANHRALYDTAEHRVRHLLERRADFGWFDTFFGTPPSRDVVVAPLLAAPGTFSAESYQRGQRTKAYTIIGPSGVDSAGFPLYDNSAVGDVVQDVVQAHVYPLVDDDSAAFATAGAPVYDLVADAMREQGVGGWPGMIYASLSKAVLARYYGRHGDAPPATTADQAAGWVWIPELADVLGRYEADRTTYPTLKAFMPAVTAFFDSLPDRLPAMRQRFDQQRPRIISISPDNGSDSVDATVKEIVITFDRPMRSTMDLETIPGARSHVPHMGRAAFDSTSTVLRIPVTLDPGHEYEFALNRASGGSFVSADGIPLARYHVHFQTRQQ